MELIGLKHNSFISKSCLNQTKRAKGSCLATPIYHPIEIYCCLFYDIEYLNNHIRRVIDLFRLRKRLKKSIFPVFRLLLSSKTGFKPAKNLILYQKNDNFLDLNPGWLISRVWILPVCQWIEISHHLQIYYGDHRERVEKNCRFGFAAAFFLWSINIFIKA